MLLLRRPTPGQLERFAADARSESLTYAAVGATLTGSGPSGYHYADHRGADLEVFADGPIAVGTTVAVAAPLPLAAMRAAV